MTILDKINSETQDVFPSYDSLREKVLFSSPENLSDRFNRARLGFQLGTQGTTIAEEQQRVLQNKMAIEESRQKHATALFDDMLKGLDAVNNMEDPIDKLKIAKVIGRQLSSRDKELGMEFVNLAEEPAVSKTLLDPMAEQLYGSRVAAFKAFKDNPEEFKNSIIDARRTDIVDKLLALKTEKGDDAKFDLNGDGVVGSNEMRVWLKRNNKDLTIEEQNIISWQEFAPILEEVFGAEDPRTIDGDKVKATQFYDDGTVQYITENGNIVVKNPSQEIVRGEDAKNTVFKAQQYGAQLQGERAGERRSADVIAKFNAEKKVKQPKVKQSIVASRDNTDRIVSMIDETIKKVGGLTSGVGSALAWIPGSSAKNLAEDLKSIKANAGFDKLQEIRNNSPTGGALGPVSDNENALLQSVFGSLDQAQSPTQLITNLNRVKAQYLDSYGRITDAYLEDYGEPFVIDKTKDINSMSNKELLNAL